MMRLGFLLALAVALWFPALWFPAPASAFCGFYVSGAEASLYNEASLVVLMRDGTRTVVSMQNDYQGPVEDFAMVIPVPEVLSRASVKTLSPEIFARVDRLAAPRLVEYFEMDPCAYDVDASTRGDAVRVLQSLPGVSRRRRAPRDLGVEVEAEFAVGEYDVLILSAEDSSGLETWLRQERYQLPEGAAAVLRPYVERDMKFFVAKVAVDRVVTLEDGRVLLSPLRFHYDADDFFLPIRLGLLNSSGEQDILVHILARGVRYEVANYDNYAVPTNIRLSDVASENFGAFYDALISRMVEVYPGSVVTEYAWNAASCDPCPDQPLNPSELVTLGAEVIPSYDSHVRQGRVPRSFQRDFVLTRLHARVTADAAGEDLYFRPAPAITGGQGTPDEEGVLITEVTRQAGDQSAFQGRFVDLHKWDGPIECDAPRRGRWAVRPPTPAPSPFAAKPSEADANPPVDLADDVSLGADGLPSGQVALPPPPPSVGCSRCSMSSGLATGALPLGMLAVLGALRRQRHSR